MVEKFVSLIIKRFLVKGWKGSFTVHVNDGVPMKVEAKEVISIQEIA